MYAINYCAFSSWNAVHVRWPRTSHETTTRRTRHKQMTGPRFSKHQFTYTHYLASGAWSRPVRARRSLSLCGCKRIRVFVIRVTREHANYIRDEGVEEVLLFCCEFVVDECVCVECWHIAFCVVPEQTSHALMNVTREPRSLALRTTYTTQVAV